MTVPTAKFEAFSSIGYDLVRDFDENRKDDY